MSLSFNSMGRYLIVVDDDIDPTNTNDVLWALATRSDPATDIETIQRTLSGPLDPIARKEGSAYYSSKAVIDACRPFESYKEFPKVVEASEELQEKTLEKWGHIWSD